MLTGVNFKFYDNKLECTATDSYRLAKKEITLENNLMNKYNIIIPTKNLNELIRAKILIKAVFYKGCFTEEDNNRHNSCSPSTDVLFTFKNMPVKMRIIDTDTTIEPVYILNVKYINVAIRNILEFINYNYGQEYIKETR